MNIFTVLAYSSVLGSSNDQSGERIVCFCYDYFDNTQMFLDLG